MRSKERLWIDLKKMISQNKAERPLNITSILNNFKSFITQIHQKNGRKTLRRNRIKLITSEQK